MKPVMQTDNTIETGDCFAACVASILEVELKAVVMDGDRIAHNPAALWEVEIEGKKVRPAIRGVACYYPIIPLDPTKGN